MLPDFRQLVAMICLALSVLIFAFGAAALLRSAHDDFAALQSQRAGREPGRAQFALNTGNPNLGAVSTMPISDATAKPRDAQTSGEPNLAALQFPDTSTSTRETDNTATPVPDKAAGNIPAQAEAPLPDSRSTLTITDRAAAPVEPAPAPNSSATIVEAIPDDTKNQIALNAAAPLSQSPDKIADTTKDNTSGAGDLKSETRVQDSD